MTIERIPQQRIDEAVALLRRIEKEFAPAAFANSLGAEDMVLTDLIARHTPGIEMFTLDTGRLHEETYRLMQQVADQYDQPLRVYFPRPEAVQQYATAHGVNGFYDSVESRKACCQARKVEPLGRALKGKTAWITGLRREQAVTRRELPEREFDAAHGIEKFNPLAAWSQAEVWAYIHAYGVPYNELLDWLESEAIHILREAAAECRMRGPAVLGRQGLAGAAAPGGEGLPARAASRSRCCTSTPATTSRK
jgi:phosphoadenosine phosphosulfate reductase